MNQANENDGHWPQDDLQDPQDPEELDEEAQRDWEALLYSQIHHEQQEPAFSIRSVTHSSIITTPTEPRAPELPVAPNAQENEASNDDDDEEEDEDDDGIMVLPRPVVVPVDIPLISLDSSEDEPELQVHRERGPRSRSESDEDGDNVRKFPETRPSTSTQVVDLVSSSGLSSGEDQDCVEEQIVIQGQPIPAQAKTMEATRRSHLTINESTSDHSLTENERPDTPPPNPKTKRKRDLKKKGAEVLQAYKAVFASSDDSSGDERLSLGSGEVSLNLLAPQSKRSWLSALNLDPLTAFKNCPAGEHRPTRIHKWTDDMYRFYNKVNETAFHATLDDIMEQIPENANWRVNRTDRMAMFGSDSSLYRRGKSRYFDRNRCGNCKQMGHLARQCPDPVKPLICNMCAARGHLRHACPNASCLRCSQPSHEFTSNCFHCRKLNKTYCLECGAPGHAKQNCPDLWRRFHQTVEPGGVFQPEDHDRIHKSESEMSCPNCAREGHSLHKCRGFRPSTNPFPVLKVVSYKEPPNLMPEEPLISSKKKLRKWLRAEAKAKKRAYLAGNEEESPVLAKKLKFLVHDEGDDLAAQILQESDRTAKPLSKAMVKKARLAQKAMAKWEKLMNKPHGSTSKPVDDPETVTGQGSWAQAAVKFSKSAMMKFVKAIPLNEVPVLPAMAFQKLKAQANVTRKQLGGAVPHEIELTVASQMTYLQRMISKNTPVMSRDNRRNVKCALGSLKYVQKLVKDPSKA